MRLVITEKQLKELIRLRSNNQELTEDGAEGAPEAGTSSDGETKTGASKWESGVTRGPANQIAVTKWADSYKITRGRANPLNEQGSFDIAFNRRYGTYDAAVKSAAEDRELVRWIAKETNWDAWGQWALMGGSILAATFIPGAQGLWIAIGLDVIPYKSIRLYCALPADCAKVIDVIADVLYQHPDESITAPPPFLSYPEIVRITLFLLVFV